MKKFISKLTPQTIKNIYHLFVAKKALKKYNNPSQNLKIIGVTGTDGKTSTSTIIYEILKAAGKKVGLITTISAKIGDKEYPTGFHVTSPDPEDLQKFLRKMVNANLEYVVLETTSHGLYQNRVYGIEYIAAVYTNISHEHLDHHGSLESYLNVKAKLMKQTNTQTGFSVINHDDQSYEVLQKYSNKLKLKSYTYGLSEISDIYAADINEEVNKTEFVTNFRGEEWKIQMHLPGRYNVYNALAAITVAVRLGISKKNINKGLGQLLSIEGRWEVIQSTPFKVVIDFAHTPNALYNVLKYAQEANEHGKLFVVFGSAGKRDKTKRPLMGEAAATFADISILTAEDPRGEDVMTICKEIAEGLHKKDKVENIDYFIQPDRKTAIEMAINMANAGDTILITGKGHERSMNMDGKTEILWSDVNETEELLNAKKLEAQK